MKTSQLIAPVVQAVAGLIAFLALSSSAGATTSFFDGTFNLAGYTHTGSYTSNGTSSNNISQSSTNGDPGFNLLVQSMFTTGTGNLADGYANNSFTYDPGVQGAITSIDTSADIMFSSMNTGNYFTAFFPLIQQGGVSYIGEIFGPNTSQSLPYTNYAGTGLLATDFSQYDFTTGSFGSAHPNFSSGVMTYGIGLLTTDNESSSNTFTQNIDNLAYTIHSTPEPTGVALLACGCIALACRRRR